MIESITGIRGQEPAAAVANSGAARAPAAAPPVGEPLPDAPPDEVLEALAAAQRAIRELERAQIRLRFEVHEGEDGRRVSVKVYDAEGRVIRTIPPSKLGPLLAGEALPGLLVDERG